MKCGAVMGRFASFWATYGMYAFPLLALLLLLLPTYHDVALRLWKSDEQAYAPLLAALSFWLIWHRLCDLRLVPDAGMPVWGLLLLFLGATVYVMGRSQQIELLELGGCIPILAGVISIHGGRAALRRMRFPLLFLLFSLPYPGWLVNSLTGPLKEYISIGAESVLYAAGYPIARNGVVLGLGPYRLLVADACSGLHSLIFLSALGLLYVQFTGHRQVAHRLMLVTALLPIAVLANFVRVLILLLLTHHFGDAVGQGYWHDLAGVILYISAFAMLIVFDTLISKLSFLYGPKLASQRERDVMAITAAAPGWGRSLAVSIVLLGAAACATMLTPTRSLAERRPVPDLESQIPASFGDWIRDNQADILLVAPDLQASVKRLYSQTISRTYVNRQGLRVMLSIAYGGNQLGNELQAHRPEYCYKAQGFTLLDSNDARIKLLSGDLPVRRLVARQHNRIEPITYWMVVGETPALPGIQRKLAQLSYGLRGEIPDGMLIRVSSLDGDLGRAFSLQESFISGLQNALPPSLHYIFAQPASQSHPN